MAQTLRTKDIDFKGLNLRIDTVKMKDFEIDAAPTVAGGDAATAGASHVLPVKFNGVTYFVLLSNDNS